MTTSNNTNTGKKRRGRPPKQKPEDPKEPEITDTDRINVLEQLLAKKTFNGRCRILPTRNGRGFSLEETNVDPTFGTVREALDDYMDTHGMK